MQYLLNHFKQKPVDNVSYIGLSTDSRLIEPGWIFLAISGQQQKGWDFIDQAIDLGAVAVLTVPHSDCLKPMKKKSCWIYPLRDLEAKAGDLLHDSWGLPSQYMSVIGITGTNGKTSSSFFLAQILQGLSQSVGLMGTLGLGVYPLLETSSNTTPSLDLVHRTLNRFHQSGVKWSLLEVTSHALAQSRVSGVQFETALWTNLTQDHLDFHGTMTEYFQAKLQLFKIPGLKVAIINLDNDYVTEILNQIHTTIKVYSYALKNNKADVWAASFQQYSDHMIANVHTPWGQIIIRPRLLGQFNLSNVLGVIAILGHYQFPLAAIAPIINQIQAVPGRMNSIQHTGTPQVIIDYAHTPDALKKALATLNDLKVSKLICLFGCGGERDRKKRPLMMREALLGSTHVVLTEDNSRNESFDQIARDAMSQLTDEQRTQIGVIDNRKTAIEETILKSDPSDIILIAGKGHELYQIKSGKTLPFNETEIVNLAFEQYKNRDDFFKHTKSK